MFPYRVAHLQQPFTRSAHQRSMLKSLISSHALQRLSFSLTLYLEYLPTIDKREEKAF